MIQDQTPHAHFMDTLTIPPSGQGSIAPPDLAAGETGLEVHSRPRKEEREELGIINRCKSILKRNIKSRLQLLKKDEDEDLRAKLERLLDQLNNDEGSLTERDCDNIYYSIKIYYTMVNISFMFNHTYYSSVKYLVYQIINKIGI